MYTLLNDGRIADFKEVFGVSPSLKSMVLLYIGYGVGELFEVVHLRFDVVNESNGSMVRQRVIVFDAMSQEIVLELRELVAC